MTQKKKRHNKKRNTGLLYEFLIRHASNCALHKQQEEMDRTLKIIKKYFKKGTPLHEELSIFKALNNTTVKSRGTANKILNSVYKTSGKMNVRELDVHKSNLIKEVNHTLNKNVYNYKIPNYTVFASAQTLFNNNRNKKKFLNEIDQLKLEEVVTDYLLLEKKKGAIPEKDKVYNKTVYTMMMKNFHEKYSGLNESQKKILFDYTTFLINNDEKTYMQTVLSEVKKIKEKLSNIQDESIKGSEETKKKLNECVNQLNESKLNTSEETALMLLEYLNLVGEIENNG
jgi:hypothetical protein